MKSSSSSFILRKVPRHNQLLSFSRITLTLTSQLLEISELSHVKIFMIFHIFSVLHIAAYNNNSELVKNLLEHAVSHPSFHFWINIVNEEGFTALHMASYRGNLV